jgi:hypothetical protein
MAIIGTGVAFARLKLKDLFVGNWTDSLHPDRVFPPPGRQTTRGTAQTHKSGILDVLQRIVVDGCICVLVMVRIDHYSSCVKLTIRDNLYLRGRTLNVYDPTWPSQLQGIPRNPYRQKPPHLIKSDEGAFYVELGSPYVGS